MKKIAIVWAVAFATLLPAAEGQEAQEILDACHAPEGLIVAIGWDSPQWLAGLRRGESVIVQGLDPDPAKVTEAREHLTAEGLYGPVTVSRLTGRELPYINNLVNVLVVANTDARVADEEMERVCAPLGTLVKVRQAELKVTRKPWPDDLDHWTHYLYDASNHALSRDTAVAPPRGLQWTCGPEYARSHEHFGSVSAMVSAAGRVFYIIDEGPISSVFLPPDWKLIARSAFSGVKLWELPIANWESQLRGFRSGPPELGRRLIAISDRVFAALDYGEPVTVIDAATGKKLRTFAATEGARELLYQDDVLYVLADDMTAADHDARKRWINETATTLRGYQFPKRPLAMYGKQRIVALDIETGEPHWVKKFTVPGELMPATMAVAADRVCVQTVDHVLCLDAGDGAERWRTDRPVARSRYSWSTPTLVIHNGMVLTVDRVASASADKTPPQDGSKWIMDNTHQSRDQDGELVCCSLTDGEEIWRAPCLENYDTQLDIFVIDGVVWVGDLRHRGDSLQSPASSLQPDSDWPTYRRDPRRSGYQPLPAPGGFLDTTWWHRTYWIYGKGMQSGYGGWPRVGNVVPAGRLLVTDGGELIYGYGRMSYRAGAGHVHPDAAKDYKLFAEVLAPESKPQDTRKGRKPVGRRVIKWARSLPFVVRSLVLTEDALLVAGGESLIESPDRHGPGTLWIASRKDGTKQAESELPASPVLDGAALTDCGVFLTTLDGTAVGLRSGK